MLASLTGGTNIDAAGVRDRRERHAHLCHPIRVHVAAEAELESLEAGRIDALAR